MREKRSLKMEQPMFSVPTAATPQRPGRGRESAARRIGRYLEFCNTKRPSLGRVRYHRNGRRT
jgi:hypothetical protein